MIRPSSSGPDPGIVQYSLLNQTIPLHVDGWFRIDKDHLISQFSLTFKHWSLVCPIPLDVCPRLKTGNGKLDSVSVQTRHAVTSLTRKVARTSHCLSTWYSRKRDQRGTVQAVLCHCLLHLRHGNVSRIQRAIWIAHRVHGRLGPKKHGRLDRHGGQVYPLAPLATVRCGAYDQETTYSAAG